MPDIASTDYPSVPAFLKRTSWAAIIAGVIVTLVVQLVLSLLGLAIGLGTINPLTERNPVAGLGVGSSIWFAVSTLIALYLGGWVAGHLAGMPRKIDSGLHGVLTWGIATLLTFYFMTTAVGGLVSGTASVLGKGLNLAGQGAAAVAPKVSEVVTGQMQQQGIDLGAIQRDAQSLLSQGGQAGVQEMSGVISRVFANGGQNISQADRNDIVRILTTHTNMTAAQANDTVNRWQQNAIQAQAKFDQLRAEAERNAREIGDKAAAAMSKAAFWSFIGLVLGGIAATFGGINGMPRDTVPPGDTSTRATFTREKPAFQG